MKKILLGLIAVAIIGGAVIYIRKSKSAQKINVDNSGTKKMTVQEPKKMTIAESHNNPLNIRITANTPKNPWKGMLSIKTGDKFVRFSSPEYGFRAAGILLNNYAKLGVVTLNKIVERWAPASDGNDTAAYIKFVASKMGIPATTVIKSDKYPALLQAMALMEGGKTYGLDLIRQGLSIK